MKINISKLTESELIELRREIDVYLNYISENKRMLTPCIFTPSSFSLAAASLMKLKEDFSTLPLMSREGIARQNPYSIGVEMVATKFEKTRDITKPHDGHLPCFGKDPSLVFGTKKKRGKTW